MLLTFLARSSDYLSTLFNFFLIISANTVSQSLVDVREVLVGGCIGVMVGGAFGILTELASGWPYDCGASPICVVFPSPVYFLHCFWSVPLGVSLCYYLVSVFGIQGPDFLQLGLAICTVLGMILVPFRYEPLVEVLAPSNLLTPVVMSAVTRVISLATTAIVALVFVGIGALMDYCKRKQRKNANKFLN